MVLHKLVNSTNVVFHMLDLHPYAMVLPMDKSSGPKNKKKILSKVLKNNPEFYETYKFDVKNFNIEKNTFDEKDLSEQLSPQSLKDKYFKEENMNKLNYPLEIADYKEDINLTKIEPLKREETSNPVDSTTNVEHNDFQDMELTETFEESSDDIFSGVKKFIERLDSENIFGCMIILARKGSDKKSISPVAGGIVEVFDDYERSIQVVWLNRNIGKYVSFSNLKGKKNSKKLIMSLNDQVLGRIILSTLTLRLCAHAYQMTLPNSKRIQHKSRLISIYHVMGQTFPNFAYRFIKEDMQFSKHYEISKMSVKHNDNPRIPCKCLKDGQPEQNDTTETTIPEEDAPLFFGITESRFSAMYTTTFEPILMGFMNILSGKLNDVSKIMRFEGGMAKYYQNDDDFSLKRRKLNYRSKRLQERV